ncbi:hypothetical protein T440DRAFT_451417 [Plenodomus tracheiphilus IPT5]|uniref:CFEM domain-containing protein n=1 Tax=Plenodomus tracheiphilus IPT5 TaxID=1408161 RepID=A0A6A7B5W9_9PLEO|nr:hypothetical protein T440DRAFT_451417 [Plenodomus tracheiphilus IPT5]
MMLLLRRAFLLWVLCLVSMTLSQETHAPNVPACAANCLVGGFSTKFCAPTDKVCICTNDQFKANVTACIAVSCTIPESLAAKNASAISCGAPVRAHGEKYIMLSNIMVAFAAAFVAMRFAFKFVVAQLDIGMDDWSVLACLIAATPNAVITVFGTVKNGLGRDIWTLTPAEITEMLKYFYVMASLYFTQVALLKLTLIFFYIRVFPSKGVQRLLWGTVVFVALWGFSYVIVAIFQCRPIRYFWTKWDGLHNGTCLDINAITASNAGLSIALDLWILGIPLWQLYGLKLHWKKKFGVALMFCVGTFVTIVSILRLRALVHFAESDNASWEFYDVSVWSTIEICVGIMCACLPTLRLLLVRLFPILGGSSARSRANDKYYKYGSNNELKSVGQSHRSHNVNATVSSVSHAGGPNVYKEDDGIMVKTSYTIQRSQVETDEMSLVSHESGKAKS